MVSAPDPISSATNPIVKAARAAREGRKPGVLVAEGVRLVEEAVEAGLEIRTSLVAPRLYRTPRGKRLAARLAAASVESRECSDDVMARASGLESHQGVLAIVAVPRYADRDLLHGENPFVVLAAGVRDPGNLGALVRTAEAAGASGLLSLAGSADPFRDKAVRGSAGSVFRLPARSGVTVERALAFADENGVTLIGADGRRGTPLWETELGPMPLAFVLGAEASGLPKPLAEACAQTVRIPTAPSVESLNVSVAAGIVLFELRRRLGGPA